MTESAPASKTSEAPAAGVAGGVVVGSAQGGGAGGEGGESMRGENIVAGTAWDLIVGSDLVYNEARFPPPLPTWNAQARISYANTYNLCTLFQSKFLWAHFLITD